MLGLHCCADFSLVAASAGFSCYRARPPGCTGFIICGTRAQQFRLRNHGARPWLLSGMWDLPRSGIEPVSLALEGGVFTTEPRGSPLTFLPNAKCMPTTGYQSRCLGKGVGPQAGTPPPQLRSSQRRAWGTSPLHSPPLLPSAPISSQLNPISPPKALGLFPSTIAPPISAPSLRAVDHGDPGKSP